MIVIFYFLLKCRPNQICIRINYQLIIIKNLLFYMKGFGFPSTGVANNNNTPYRADTSKKKT